MKKFIGLTIITAALTFSVLLILSVSHYQDTAVDRSLSNPSNLAQNNNRANISSPVSPSKNLPNLTENLAKKISEELITLNPNGPETIKNQQWLNVAKPDDLAGKLFEETLNDFDINSLRSSVDLAHLKISNKTDVQAMKDYIDSFKNIIAVNFRNLPITNQSEPFLKLTMLINAYSQALPRLYQLEVPKNAALIHQEGIALLETQKNILEKLLNSENDPVAALFAAQLMPIINQEVIDFENKMNKLIN